LVDSDIDFFPASLLHAWKREAENAALQALLQPFATIGHNHAPVPNISGKTYHEAREALINYNWQPMMNHWSHAHSFVPFTGNAQIFWERGYHELVTACPTGYAFCLFKFHDIYKNTLHVVTAGEEDAAFGCQAHIQSYWLEIKDSRDGITQG
jgi:hypothetical protein